ncbi:hypothetical protein GH714_006501 [Hevea brasiliensis]|uniref:Uncharacterized protein n=1 Tax=Hevea brasiliensis TaxID=3981 RepID=A0A6A6M8T1_HEVBR|nr:hypothetical protein GH714_006501 [Hevea brasiliensis]
MVVYVQPSHGKNVSQAILRERSSLLFKFNALDKHARILSGVHPYFGVRLKANLLLFSPKPNNLLEGKVVKLMQEWIHVIVLGFSPAVVVDEDIRSEFRYKFKSGKGAYVSRARKRHVIKVGTVIKAFKIDSIYATIVGWMRKYSAFPILDSSLHWKRWLDGDAKNATTERNVMVPLLGLKLLIKCDHFEGLEDLCVKRTLGTNPMITCQRHGVCNGPRGGLENRDV